MELRLNGQLVGEKALTVADKMHAEMTVPYAPGVLESVAYLRGKVIGRRQFETVGPATRLALVIEPYGGSSSTQSLSFVRVEVQDAQGRVLPDDKRAVRLSIDGPADLVAFGNANPLATGSLQRPDAQTWRGQALAILRSRGMAETVQV